MSDNAGTKRTAADAELEADGDVKRISADPLAMLSSAQNRQIMHASGQTLALRASNTIDGAIVGAYIRDMTLSQQAAMVATLAASADNCGLVSTLLTALSSNELWLHQHGDELLVFTLVDSPCSDACVLTLHSVTDLAVLDVRSVKTGDTILHRAVQMQNCAFVAHLLACGVAVQYNNRGHHALYASIANTTETEPEPFRAIIIAFNCARQCRPGLFDPNAIIDGKTFLGFLCTLPYPTVVEAWLMAMDSDCLLAPGQQVDQSRLPRGLGFAEYAKWPVSILDHPESVFAHDIELGMQLHKHGDIVYEAIERGRIDVIRELFRQKVKIHTTRPKPGTDDDILTPMTYLCHVSDNYKHDTAKMIDIATLIMNHKYLLPPGSIVFPLSMAIKRNLIVLVQFLIDNKVDVTGIYRHPIYGKTTALHIALTFFETHQNTEIIRLLVKHGILSNMPKDMVHPMIFASALECIDPLAIILDGLGDNTTSDILDRSLASACNHKRVNAARLLIERGAKCTTKMLICAMMAEDRDTVSFVLEQLDSPPVDVILDLAKEIKKLDMIIKVPK